MVRYSSELASLPLWRVGLAAQLVPCAEKRIFREWVTTMWVPYEDAPQKYLFYVFFSVVLACFDVVQDVTFLAPCWTCVQWHPKCWFVNGQGLPKQSFFFVAHTLDNKQWGNVSQLMQGWWLIDNAWHIVKQSKWWHTKRLFFLKNTVCCGGQLRARQSVLHSHHKSACTDVIIEEQDLSANHVLATCLCGLKIELCVAQMWIADVRWRFVEERKCATLWASHVLSKALFDQSKRLQFLYAKVNWRATPFNKSCPVNNIHVWS